MCVDENYSLLWFTYQKAHTHLWLPPTKHRWCTPLATKIYNIYILFKTQENSRAAFCIYKIRVVPLSTKVVGEVNSLFKVENLIKRWRAKLWFWETENVILNINIDRHNSAQWTDRIHVTVCRLTSGGPCNFVIPALPCTHFQSRLDNIIIETFRIDLHNVELFTKYIWIQDWDHKTKFCDPYLC